MNSKIPAILVLETEAGNGRFYPFFKPALTIGRGQSNDVVIVDQRASRDHARIQRQDHHFLLQDLQSTNGTWVNGQKIEQVRLKDGDKIKIGETQFHFKAPGVGDQEIAHFLGGVQLLATVSQETRRKLSTGAQFSAYSKGHKMPAQVLDDSLYIVLSGQLSAMKKASGDAGAVEVNRYPSGQFFDGSVLKHRFPVDYLEATEDTWLLILNREKLDELIVPFLQELDIFDGLSRPQLQAIARTMFIEYYNEGAILFHQGDPADALYMVIFGEVAMVVYAGEGDQYISEELRSYGAGSIFGELGILVEQPRAASGRVDEKTALFVLPRDGFQEITAQHPEITLSLYRYVATLLGEQSVVFWRAARDLEKMKELIQATKMAALGQLVAGIAHEMNTPVGSISSNSRQLQELLAEASTFYETLTGTISSFYHDENLEVIAAETGYALDEPARRFVAEVARRQMEAIQNAYEREDIEALFLDMADISEELGEASKRITNMVKSLANYTRFGQADRKLVDIHEGLDATLSLLHHELKYKVVVEKEYGELPRITCYPNQLNQVFTNILINAIQALELDKLGDGQKGHIHVKTYRDGRYAVVAIQDNGKGIALDDLSKIFEPYFSTKGAAAAAGGLGLGLGLSISQKIVEEKHGGKIEVASKLGHGSTFYIKLPIDKLALDQRAHSLSTQTMLLQNQGTGGRDPVEKQPDE